MKIRNFALSDLYATADLKDRRIRGNAPGNPGLLREAANEIERLRRELADEKVKVISADARARVAEHKAGIALLLPTKRLLP